MPLTEGAKVATGFIETLKNQPLLLVLAVTNFATLGFVFFQTNQFNNQRSENVKLFIEQQVEFNKLLAKCIVVDDKKTNWRPPFKLTPEKFKLRDASSEE
jgi:hypothetical protein